MKVFLEIITKYSPNDNLELKFIEFFGKFSQKTNDNDIFFYIIKQVFQFFSSNRPKTSHVRK